MAVLDPNEIFFTAFEPKQANRFILYVDGIPAYVVKGVGAVTLTQGTVELNHINVSRFVKGKSVWDPISLTLFDPSGGITVDLAEVLVFNKSLSDQDRSKITSYLANKWGLTTTVDSDGDGIVDASDPFPTDPSRWISFPEALRDNVSDNFTAINGLALWLDARNIDGNHNSGLNDGDSVSVWKDLSGKNIDLKQSISDYMPIYSSNSVVFDGSDDRLENASLDYGLINEDASIFVALHQPLIEV